MVKRIAIFFAYFFFFLLALMYFSPKMGIYYFAEQELRKYDVIISNESVNDNGFSLALQNAHVSVQAIESADIENINIKILALYNSVNIQNITLSNTAAAFVPLKIEKVSIKYSIFNPLNIKAYALGEFGEAEATFNLLKLALHIDLVPSKMMINNYISTMRNLKKSEDGGYVYDQTF